MAGYGGKGGGGYGGGAGAGYGAGGMGAVCYNCAGKPGGSYPLALVGGQGRSMSQGQPYGQLGQQAYNRMGNGITPYGGGMGQGAMQPYSSNSKGRGLGDDGMNIAVIVQTNMGTYSFFVGADGRAGMDVPGGSFRYMPNSALGGGKSLDGLLGKYNAGKPGGLEGQMLGPGMGGYDALKNQMPDLRDFGDADYKMRDPNYSRNMVPEDKKDYQNGRGLQSGIMRQAPKARYDELSKQTKEGGTDNYGYSSAGKAQARTKEKQREPTQMREPSQLERVAMELPVNGYQAMPLGV